MIIFYDNWYQLNDNGLYDRPERGRYDGRAFLLFCLAVRRARLLDDFDTVVFVTEKQAYKLKLSEHTPADQNNIVDALIPKIEHATDTSKTQTRR